MASAPRLRLADQQSPETHNERLMELPSESAIKTGKAGRPVLRSFDEMPEWFREGSNKWILHGYRPVSSSVCASFRSLLYLHNESVNIYSHLVTAFILLLGERSIRGYLIRIFSGVTAADDVAFSIFMLAAGTCLSLSATYHTLMNHSKHVERLCLRLDMLGVVIFILGDLALGIYVVFWCDPLLRGIYWSLVGQPSRALRMSSILHLTLYSTSPLHRNRPDFSERRP